MTDEEFNAECRANDQDTPMDRYRNLWSAALLQQVRSEISPTHGRDHKAEREEWRNSMVSSAGKRATVLAAEFAGHDDPEATLQWILGLYGKSPAEKDALYREMFTVEEGS